MLGFRERLSTQDAMIQLQHDILDTSVRTQDNRAVLGLDLKSAFDEVKHSAILEQAGRLGLGRRSYNYIRDFLSERTVEIHAGDLQLPPKKLGSTGTPQGSTAVDAIEHHLDGKGLRCSPQKSELLIVPPPGKYRKREAEDSANIRIRTRDSAVIPRVDTLRVLGICLEASRSNKTTVDRLVTKIGSAARLVRRVAMRHSGMKEANLLRLLQSFAMSHVAYVGAFHYWLRQERDRINAAIRKAYKTALGLICRTSTFERLASKRTGRCILERLGMGPKTTDSHRHETTQLQPEVMQRRRILPLPRNIHPDRNRGRREARCIL
ncbi:uncharacterized protein LOC144160634 [Haemaphysalis longicornis]